MTQGERRRHDRSGDVFWGVLLIALGTWLLLLYFGWAQWDVLGKWWPVGMAVVGALRVLTARSAEAVGSGTTIACIGVWCLIAVNNWHGLTWSRSWPFALIAAGLGTLARSVAERWMPEEDRHAQR